MKTFHSLSLRVFRTLLSLCALAPLFASAEAPVPEAKRFARGITSNDPTYHAFVIPVDFQKGIQLPYFVTPDQAQAPAAFANFPRGYPWYMADAFRAATVRPTTYQIALDTVAQRLLYPTGDLNLISNMPIAAFGTQGGAEPLYINQPYRFATHAGLLQRGLGGDPAASRLVIHLAKRNLNGSTGIQGGSFATHEINLPLPVNNATGQIDTASGWEAFGNNGFRLNIETLANPAVAKSVSNPVVLETTVQYLDNGYGQNLGVDYDAPLLITHICRDPSYVFQVSYRGYAVRLATGTRQIVQMGAFAATRDNSGNFSPADLPLYTMDFEEEPAWRTRLMDTPHFARDPMPSTYIGKTIEEIEKKLPAIQFGTSQPGLPTGDPTGDPVVDNAPEIRSHPNLDSMVTAIAGTNNDPLAIVNYVHNEIGLVDALSWNEQGAANAAEISVNAGGVSRGALATFMEGQGNPWEQCALLVYMLRQARHHALYVKAPHNTTKIMAKRLSHLLRMQIVGVQNSDGTIIQDTDMIPVNYPWVAAYLPSDPQNPSSQKKWVHLFPWFKDTEIVEGYNLFEYLNPKSESVAPTEYNQYNSGFKWIEKYLKKDTAIFPANDAFGQSHDDTPLNLFPKFITQKLNQWHPGISIDHLGVAYRDRIHQRHRWEDFPRPYMPPDVAGGTVATLPSDTSAPTDFTKNTRVASSLSDLVDAGQDIFDRVEFTLASMDSPTNRFSTANIRLLDLHNRRITGYFSGGSTVFNFGLQEFKPSLSTATADDWVGLTAPDDILKPQRNSLPGLARTTNVELTIKLTRHRHLAGRPGTPEDMPTYLKSLPTAWRSFLGVQNALVHTQKITFVAGDHASLCMNLGRVSQRMVDAHLEDFKKATKTLEDIAPGSRGADDRAAYYGAITQLMGYSYYRDLDLYIRQLEQLLKVQTLSRNMFGLSKMSGKWVEAYQSYEPSSPIVDMVVMNLASVGAGQLRPDSGGRDILTRRRDFSHLFIAGASALEHQTIKYFFPQESLDAVSTVNLLHRCVPAAPASPAFVLLNRLDYKDKGELSFTSKGTSKKLKDWDPGIWKQVVQAFEGEAAAGELSSTGHYVRVWITPGPVTGANGAFTGMGALIIAPNSAAALIGSLSGGFGGLLSNTSGLKLGQTNAQQLPGRITLTTNANTLAGLVGSSMISSGLSSSSSRNVLSGITLGANAISRLAFTSSSDNNRIFISNSFSSGNSSALISNLFGSSSIFTTTPQTNLLNIALTGGRSTGTTFQGFPSSTAPITLGRSIVNTGYLGNNFNLSPGISLFGGDPVNFLTGEFYIDEVDLSLPGPLPIELRRNYSSQHLGDGGLGLGWKVAYFPYLVLEPEEKAAKEDLIRAAELDGSVITYRPLKNGGTWIEYNDENDIDGDNDKGTEGGTDRVYRWGVFPQDNPSMSNGSGAVIGSVRNPFHNVLERIQVSVGVFIYCIHASDGSHRYYKTKEFPLADPNGGATTIHRRRPYIEKWQDHAGNFLTFQFGTSSQSLDYGQVKLIQASNGNAMNYLYDPNGHITEAFTADGRRVIYTYNNYGDLSEVRRPDNSWVKYDYLLQKAVPTGGTKEQSYSTHLIEYVRTPTRTLKNAYQNYAAGDHDLEGNVIPADKVGKLSHTRRITHQWASIGRHGSQPVESTAPHAEPQDALKPADESYELVLQAKISYSNTRNTDTASPNFDTLNGHTTIADPYGRETIYYYTGSKISAVRRRGVKDPLSSTAATKDIITSYQEWYPADATTTTSSDGGAFPRALSRTIAPFEVDAVADEDIATHPTPPASNPTVLINDFKYSSTGDLVRTLTTGDMDGDGNSDTYETTGAYDPVTHMPTQVTDAIGRITQYTYDHPDNKYLATTITRYLDATKLAAGLPISSTINSYTNAGTQGTIPFSKGLLQRTIVAAGTTDEAVTDWTYTPTGFPDSQTQWIDSGVALDGNPAPSPANSVTHQFRYNLRGELVETIDPAGHKTAYAYDDLGRRIWEERLNSINNNTFEQVAWNYSYYNLNGELEWTDGSRSNPEDYTYTRYDGAGRPVEQVRWRSRANAAGTGVEAPPGADRYSVVVNKYNLFGDLIVASDPRGNEIWSRYDTIGRKIATASFQGSPGASVPWSTIGTLSPTTTPKLLAYATSTYDPAGRVVSTTDALGRTTTTQYTADGKPHTVTGPLGIPLHTRYDQQGRVIRQPHDTATFWRITYDDQKLTVSRELRRITADILNGADLPAAMQISEFTQLDRRGNVIQKTTGNGPPAQISALSTSVHVVTSTTTYDDLNRPTLTSGPPGTTTGSSGTSQTQRTAYFYDPVNLTSTTHFGVDDSGTNPKSITKTVSDSLGRPLSSQILDPLNSNAVVTQTTYDYDLRFHYTDVTTGRDPATDTDKNFATTSRAYTDTFGKPLLSFSGRRYPTSAGAITSATTFAPQLQLLSRADYDVAGNPVTTTNELGHATFTAFDGLNRPQMIRAPDEGGGTMDTVITYDIAGQVTSRQYGNPGVNGLTEVSEYFPPDYTTIWKRGLLKRKYIRSGTGSLTDTRIYDYSASNAYHDDDPIKKGLLKSFTDPRSLTHTFTYDDRLRLTGSTIASGGTPKISRSTVLDYRGLAGSISETTPQGTSTVTHSYDHYGQLLQQTTYLGAEVLSNFVNHYDALGRRTSLATAGSTDFTQTFTHTAAGQLSGTSVNTGGSSADFTATYQYLVNGTLHQRSNDWRIAETTAWDNRGRPTTRKQLRPGANTPFFTETTSYTLDSRQATYTTSVDPAILPGLWADARAYQYDRRRHLTSESSRPSPDATPEPFAYTFDGGQSGGIGILTDTRRSGTSLHSASATGADITAGRVKAEQSLRQPQPVPVTGTAVGARTIELSLKGSPTSFAPLLDYPVDLDGTPNNNFSEGRWRTGLHLSPGDYTLHVRAPHPSGLSEALRDHLFQVKVPSSAITLTTLYDGEASGSGTEGNVTARIFKLGSGQTAPVVRQQNLTWDEENRLIAVTDRHWTVDGTAIVSSTTWTARYDALGRRAHTAITSSDFTYRVTTSEYSGINQDDPRRTQNRLKSTQTFTETSLYDPLFEFLEIAVITQRGTAAPVRTWKVHGPDLSGTYGSLNGIGGLEASIEQTLSASVSVTTTALITDSYGHSIAYASKSAATVTLTACSTRSLGYGPAPGSHSPTLFEGATVLEATTWRGRRLDATGFICLGARYYEHTCSRFLSPDPEGHESSISLYTYAGGDSVNTLDADGRQDILDSYIAMQSYYQTENARVEAAYSAALNARTCIDCHWNPDVLRMGIQPTAMPWFNETAGRGITAATIAIAAGGSAATIANPGTYVAATNLAHSAWAGPILAGAYVTAEGISREEPVDMAVRNGVFSTLLGRVESGVPFGTNANANMRATALAVQSKLHPVVVAQTTVAAGQVRTTAGQIETRVSISGGSFYGQQGESVRNMGLVPANNTKANVLRLEPAGRDAESTLIGTLKTGEKLLSIGITRNATQSTVMCDFCLPRVQATGAAIHDNLGGFQSRIPLLTTSIGNTLEQLLFPKNQATLRVDVIGKIKPKP